MTATYEKIATTTLSSTASTFTFSSISGSYTDLVAVCNLASSVASTTFMRFNGDTGSNYSITLIAGNGSTAYPDRRSNATSARINDAAIPTSTLNANVIVNFMNYSNTTTYKTFLSRANKASDATEAIVGLWRSTSAITSIELFPSAGTWSVGCTFTLYGILKAA
jgi:hypothetical protein